MPHINRKAALVVAAILAMASVFANAQLTTTMGKKSVLRVGSIASGDAIDAPMNRLIIRFKEQVGPKSGALNAASAQGQLKALEATTKTSSSVGATIDLTYVKSITPQSHVALTSSPLGRKALTELIKQIEQDPSVEHAEIDERVFPHAVNVADPAFLNGTQWNLQNATAITGSANARPAWDRTTTGLAPVSGAGVVVAVLDSGYLPHSDLAANIVLPGYDFISPDSLNVFTTANDGTPRDSDASDPGDWVAAAQPGCPVANSSWHGTRVASVIAGVKDTNGMIGVAYGAKILPVRVLGVCGGYTSDIIDGMRWAAGILSNPPVPNTRVAKVINLSLGSSAPCSTEFQAAVTAVRAAGSVVVASTGNDGAFNIDSPASCQGVITVTAHTKTGDNANYANIGIGTSISAPGGGYGTNVAGDGSGIYSVSNLGVQGPMGESYRDDNIGTSFAAPHVSGVAAMLFQIKPGILPDEVESRLLGSARAHLPGTYCVARLDCGAGMLDADAAVALTIADTAPVTHASASPTNPVARNATVTLTGMATPGQLGSAIATVGWIQLSGPAVTLMNPTTSIASFVVPQDAAVATGATYVFRYTATAMNAQTSFSQVSVKAVDVVPPAPTVPASSGGGAADWTDLAALLGFALASVVLRRSFPNPK